MASVIGGQRQASRLLVYWSLKWAACTLGYVRWSIRVWEENIRTVEVHVHSLQMSERTYIAGRDRSAERVFADRDV